MRGMQGSAELDEGAALDGNVNVCSELVLGKCTSSIEVCGCMRLWNSMKVPRLTGMSMSACQVQRRLQCGGASVGRFQSPTDQGPGLVWTT